MVLLHSTDRNRHEARHVTPLYAYQYRMLRLLNGFIDDLSKIGSGINRLASDLEDDVSSLKTAFRGAAIGINAND